MFSATIEIGVKPLRMSKSILKNSGSVTVELTLIVRTWPSAGDFATASRPIAPPAPPRFSTMKGWCHFSCMRGASVRAIRSGVVAGVCPRTKRTGRLEMPCARAAKGVASAARSSLRRSSFGCINPPSFDLFGFGAGVFHNLGPLGNFARDVGGGILRRAAGDFGAEAVQSIHQVALRERRVDGAVQTLDDRGGRRARHDDAMPGDGLEAGHAGLRYGWQIRQRR